MTGNVVNRKVKMLGTTIQFSLKVNNKILRSHDVAFKDIPAFVWDYFFLNQKNYSLNLQQKGHVDAKG